MFPFRCRPHISCLHYELRRMAIDLLPLSLCCYGAVDLSAGPYFSREALDPRGVVGLDITTIFRDSLVEVFCSARHEGPTVAVMLRARQSRRTASLREWLQDCNSFLSCQLFRSTEIEPHSSFAPYRLRSGDVDLPVVGYVVMCIFCPNHVRQGLSPLSWFRRSDADIEFRRCRNHPPIKLFSCDGANCRLPKADALGVAINPRSLIRFL
mmetsp:Transcript_35660/g.57706  ORF Transcript_35660/g.57706 Transcript_35660/m.57706 type:complete len:210 (-) Transcript_35660:214-843(-)